MTPEQQHRAALEQTQRVLSATPKSDREARAAKRRAAKEAAAAPPVSPEPPAAPPEQRTRGAAPVEVIHLRPASGNLR